MSYKHFTGVLYVTITMNDQNNICVTLFCCFLFLYFRYYSHNLKTT